MQEIMNNWWWDIIATILSIGILTLIVKINSILQEKELLPSNITRKLVHILAGPVYIITWLLFTGGIYSRYFAMLVPLLFVVKFAGVGLGLMKDDDLVHSTSRTGNPRELLGGTLHYSLIMVLCTLFIFDTGRGNFNPSSLVIIGILAGGDGLADIMGRKWGQKKFGWGGAQKSFVGSLGMLMGSFGTSLLLILIFSLKGQIDLQSTLLPLLIMSLVATFVEALSPKDIDNITITIALILCLVLLSEFRELWPFSYFNI